MLQPLICTMRIRAASRTRHGRSRPLPRPCRRGCRRPRRGRARAPDTLEVAAVTGRSRCAPSDTNLLVDVLVDGLGGRAVSPGGAHAHASATSSTAWKRPNSEPVADHRGELHDLGVGERHAQTGKERVVDRPMVERELVGVLDREQLLLRVVAVRGSSTCAYNSSVTPRSAISGKRHSRRTLHPLICAIRMRATSRTRGATSRSP